MGFRRRAATHYYGWYITITLAFTETISWGILYYSFSVFLNPMQADLKWSLSELTAGFSLALLTTGMLAFPVGVWIDRHGPRLLMTIGSITASVLVVAWSRVTNLTAFYGIWVGIGACAATVLYEPAFTVIAQWFIQKRSTALATVTFAAGLASTIFLPLSDALLRAYGWRTAVLILGLFLALTTIPLHALMLRRHPDALGLLPDGVSQQAAETKLPRSSVTLRGALHDRIFWLVALGFCLASLSAAAIRVHFIPFLIDAGVSASTAAFTAGLIGIMQVTGRLIFAPLDRRWSGRLILIGLFLLQSAAMMILLIGQVPLMLGLFIMIFGASQGAITLARPSILAGLYGSSHYGRISSILAVLLTITGTAAPLGASLLVDHFGNYRPVLWIVFGLALAATIVAFIARPRAIHLTGDPMQADLIEGVADGAAD